jgi:hypothetical protein
LSDNENYDKLSGVFSLASTPARRLILPSSFLVCEMKRAHRQLVLGAGLCCWLLGVLRGLWTDGALGLLGGLVGSPILLCLLFLGGKLIRWLAIISGLYKPTQRLEKDSAGSAK